MAEEDRREFVLLVGDSNELPKEFELHPVASQSS
jgi:hypothetical protein